MKDKISLVVSILLAGGAGAFIATAKGPAGLEDVAVSGPDFQTVTPTSFVPEVKAWEEPTPLEALKQPEDSIRRKEEFLVEVFTTPEIYFNETAELFTITRRQLPPPPFPVQLAGLSQDLYRILFTTNIKSGPGPKAYTLGLVDAETGESLTGKVGDTFEQSGITIKDFKVDQSFDKETGGVVTRTRVALVDTKENRNNVILEMGVPLKSDIVDIAFWETLNPSNTWQKKHKGDVFTVGENVTITVLDYDLAAETVTVKKSDPQYTKDVTRVLSVIPAETGAPEEPAGGAAQPGGAGGTEAPAFPDDF